jgi:hypothetical protein
MTPSPRKAIDLASLMRAYLPPMAGNGNVPPDILCRGLRWVFFPAQYAIRARCHGTT